MKQEKQHTLEQQHRISSYLPNILCGILILVYSVFILNFDIHAQLPLIVGIIVMILAAQCILSPITNHLLTGKLSRQIEKWLTEGATQEERTQIFLALHRHPSKKQRETITYFMVCACFLTIAYHLLLDINLFLNGINMCACFLGAYLASLLAVSYSRKVCNGYICRLVEEGIDPKVLRNKQFFGFSYARSFFSYCIVPVVWGILLATVLFIAYYYNNVLSESRFLPAPPGGEGLRGTQLARLGGVFAINTAIGSVSVYSFLHSILISSEKLQTSMLHIIKNDIFTVELVSTDFETEVSYNLHLVNQVVQLFRSILDNIRGIGSTMTDPIYKLAEISQATSSTSLEQSTGVKEILATMEDSDRQTRSIEEKISDVTAVAEGTEKNVNIGFSTLQSNLDKMTEITEANVSTISGIRELGEKIGGIWDIVKIINDIADQTRIIAFNAELEASSAGDSGKNFHIVANEVRRLAAGITASVEQIKERITEIQHSSDNLIITSESGTEKIREGLELSEKLKEKFTDIQSSSEITVESANQIKEIIGQQATAFDQIVTTVRQISSGIENFSTSTGTVNNTAQKLKLAADQLENLHKQILTEKD